MRVALGHFCFYAVYLIGLAYILGKGSPIVQGVHLALFVVGLFSYRSAFKEKHPEPAPEAE